MNYNINALPVEESGLELTTGTHNAGTFVCVTSEGELSVKYGDNNTKTVTFFQGLALRIVADVVSVTVVSGTFHRTN